jgi:hypothetical protein
MDSWPPVPFLHCTRDTVVREEAGTVLQEETWKDGHLEEMSGATGMQQWHKKPRPVRWIMSRKQEKAQQYI